MTNNSFANSVAQGGSTVLHPSSNLQNNIAEISQPNKLKSSKVIASNGSKKCLSAAQQMDSQRKIVSQRDNFFRQLVDKSISPKLQSLKQQRQGKSA